jgi:hypothetical protein
VLDGAGVVGSVGGVEGSELDGADGDVVDGGVDELRLALAVEPDRAGEDGVDDAAADGPAVDDLDVGNGVRAEAGAAGAGGACGVGDGACSADAGRTRK